MFSPCGCCRYACLLRAAREAERMLEVERLFLARRLAAHLKRVRLAGPFGGLSHMYVC